MNKNNYCVIMAGGSGSRFWPLSRTDKPKQFLDILGVGKTLLQQTFDRFSNIVPKENIIIVTNEDYKDIIFEQINIDKSQILCEPMRKNTAPCIAYANAKIFAQNPDANIVVTPSDHLITNETEFLRIAQQALDCTATNNILMTLGIKPSRPETGYGYIQISKDETNFECCQNVRKVKTFTEKPQIEMAKVFFESSEFLWNSGMFFWSLKSIMEAFNIFVPEISQKFESISEHADNEEDILFDIYDDCDAISIDYAIMEKAENVYVLCADFGWSDIGTWGSLYVHQRKDENNNAIIGANVLTYNTKDSQINVPSHKAAIIQGLDDFIVIDTDEALLICKKDEEQRIKNFVSDLKMKGGNIFI
jgi:mannose-1-phosphate guanylyltransferase